MFACCRARRVAGSPAAAPDPRPARLPPRFHEYYDDIMQHYRLEHRDGQGRSTGWPSLDLYYKVRRPGGGGSALVEKGHMAKAKPC
jgi:hypothetical protein